MNKGWWVHALNPQNLSAIHILKFLCLFIGHGGIRRTLLGRVRYDKNTLGLFLEMRPAATQNLPASPRIFYSF